MDRIASFEQMLERGQDNALLRYGLGDALLKAGRASEAVEHLRKAVELQADYTAAWKTYARALVEIGEIEQAKDIYSQGIEIAGQTGDVQAGKEMQVFLKRLQK